jgi:hypothetical protein
VHSTPSIERNCLLRNATFVRAVTDINQAGMTRALNGPFNGGFPSRFRQRFATVFAAKAA